MPKTKAPAKAPAKAREKRAPFTPDEDAAILAAVSDGKSSAEIGRMLGRSPATIRLRVQRLVGKRYTCRRFTPDEDAAILAGVRDGLTDVEIARRLGRIVGSVRGRHHYLSARGDLPAGAVPRSSYTPDEDGYIRIARASGAKWSEIARVLGRSPATVCAHYKNINHLRDGARPPARRSSRYTPAEDAAILAGVRDGLTDAETARMLGRTAYSVAKRRELLLARRENQPD